MRKPIITLTTDFGTTDHYVAVMKGVILGLCPNATLVDVSHDVQPFEVTEGAFVIAQAYRYFPRKTVHVVVVDPGVGTTRRPLLMEAGGQYFIGPDNGVFSMVFTREKHKVREMTADKFFLKPVSRTFHGRDVFAPAAAHLASGATPAQFGKVVIDYLRMNLEHPPRTGKRTWTGLILKIDRFGNLITNLQSEDFRDLALRPFEMQVGVQKISKIVQTFAEAEIGEVFLIMGSSGYLEVVANQGSAARLLGCGAGAPVDLSIY
ncbi:MAG: SAM-dependent chlorinase/fluorinase [Bryobacteraceae bacterium]